MELERAVQFIEHNSDEVEQARLRYVLFNKRPAKDMMGRVEKFMPP
jgi:hypothetical protein